MVRGRRVTLEDDPNTGHDIQNETTRMRINAKVYRERQSDAAEWENMKRTSPDEPHTTEEIQGRFISEHPDIVKDEKSLADAKNLVDEKQKQNFIEKGSFDAGSYRLYDEAASEIEKLRAIAQMEKSRNAGA
ncbi:hypothetical protein C6A37_09580 [Desulfobacteraceae bacterium SEEP-SAG9]|nr:hypothetical protein C6A37_09580 [Desulfobacteraceae bacterium SEEP-SAG9]